MRSRIVLLCFFWLAVGVSPLSGCAQEVQIDVQETAAEARQAFRSGDYEAARQKYHALAQASDSLRGHHLVRYFETFLATGEYGAGLEEVAAYLEEEPENRHLLHARGRLFAAVGRYAEAEEAYRQAGRRRAPPFWLNMIYLGELLEKKGRRSEATVLYQDIYRAYTQNQFRTAQHLAVAGKAAAELEKYHDANEAFRTAYKVDARHMRTLYWWGDLFRQKYNEADAQRTFKEALALNSQHAGMYVGLAQTVGGFGQKEELLKKALEANPQHVEALNRLAALRILDGMDQEAEEILQKALDVNPNDVEALAHLASVHHLNGDKKAFKRAEDRATAVNPRAGSFYLTIAENCTHRFRYPDAVSFTRQAIFVERDNIQAYADHGINLLRMGRTQEAHRYLSNSFDQDPFNLFVGNTLTLLDEYAHFDTLESEHVRVVVHEDESEVLGPAILQVAETSYDSLSRRYPYRPEGKITVEAYNDKDDFAVRVAGVPHLGLLGVSFGDVVAFQTPQAGAEQRQNWARTLWHELAHTMAIGVSDFHVPRWFTEGLSVYEEQRAYPYWGREMNLKLIAAFDQGKLLPLDRIDRGFTRPSFPGQILLSYYHASRVIAFIAERHGFQSIIDVLERLRSGHSIANAIKAATGQSIEEVDRAFRQRLQEQRRQLASVLDQMPGMASLLEQQGHQPDGTFLEALRKGHEALQVEAYGEAEKQFEQALEMYPDYVASGNAYEGLAAVHRARDERARLVDVLERYLTVSETAVEPARELARLHREAGRLDEALHYLERSIEVAPHHRPTHRRMAEMYEQMGRYDRAVDARRAVVALNPVDEAEAHYRLAESLYSARRLPEAKRAVLRSLEQAPGYRAAQKLLLRCVAALQ